MNLLEDSSFRPPGEVDADVPNEFGVYAVPLRAGSSLPEPFEAQWAFRRSRLIYTGKATSLSKRMLGNELPGRDHGTFFRSIGAVLGYRPASGSLVGKANQSNFSFVAEDRARIVAWINEHLEVSWAALPQVNVRETEKGLTLEHTPLINLDGNPLALAELDALRIECRAIAAGSFTPALSFLRRTTSCQHREPSRVLCRFLAIKDGEMPKKYVPEVKGSGCADFT